eukprot:6177384-Pleurochrysis_carterae.AAC.1
MLDNESVHGPTHTPEQAQRHGRKRASQLKRMMPDPLALLTHIASTYARRIYARKVTAQQTKPKAGVQVIMFAPSRNTQR